MPFLLPNQQRQSTEGTVQYNIFEKYLFAVVVSLWFYRIT